MTFKRGYSESEKRRIIKRVIEAYNQGQTATEAARACGTTMSSVGTWMRTFGIKLPKKSQGGKRVRRYPTPRASLMKATDYLER